MGTRLPLLQKNKTQCLARQPPSGHKDQQEPHASEPSSVSDNAATNMSPPNLFDFRMEGCGKSATRGNQEKPKGPYGKSERSEN
ncbi:hypothetical protein [Cupriavidus consociatus]|uniref:hypothetical protein n=1 Tax=Cupriavidus consociatus TaxID=2821357 RepID=UPI001AEA3AA0|nr:MULTISPECIES: hypothetical protein [unclassified Cupriavidus]MBP0622377.1 hypothetical protein [Cupriavidus sp. LEh25]MDK2659062.1 hypothetical protein [Cupriavidus sp. LEh21]